MDCSDKISLKIFLNISNVLEIFHLTVSPSACYAVDSFKYQLQAELFDLRANEFRVTWKDANGVDHEVKCDEDLDDAIEHAGDSKIFYVDVINNETVPTPLPKPAVMPKQEESQQIDDDKNMFEGVDIKKLMQLIPFLVKLVKDGGTSVQSPIANIILTSLLERLSSNELTASTINDFINVVTSMQLAMDASANKQAQPDDAKTTASTDNNYFRMEEGLSQLQQMGFSNDEVLMDRLCLYQGNVAAVVNFLRGL